MHTKAAVRSLRSAKPTSKEPEVAAVRQLLMPKLGLTMTEGVVAQWPLAEGARFAQGDIYLVVETDKVSTDVEAPESGRLVRICVPQGETVPVGTVLAEWEADTSTTEEPNEEAAAPPTAAPERRWRKADSLELTTARRLTESKSTIPHFYLSTEIESALYLIFLKA